MQRVMNDNLEGNEADIQEQNQPNQGHRRDELEDEQDSLRVNRGGYGGNTSKDDRDGLTSTDDVIDDDDDEADLDDEDEDDSSVLEPIDAGEAG